MEKINSNDFTEQTPEGTVIELRDLVEKLEPSSSVLACDHANNYIQVFGRLLDHRDEMLHIINAFLDLPEEKRQKHYRSIPSVI
jgi:hypothetical protein